MRAYVVDGNSLNLDISTTQQEWQGPEWTLCYPWRAGKTAALALCSIEAHCNCLGDHSREHRNCLGEEQSCMYGGTTAYHAYWLSATRLFIVVCGLLDSKVANGFYGCTDVLEGCCAHFAPNDCDIIPFNNMMEGLMCLPPTVEQCHQM